MATLKKDAPPHVLAALRQIEDQADECWRPLTILDLPSSIAIWALLTGGIRIVENEQTLRGSSTPHFDAMLGNLSRLLAIALKWMVRHGQESAPSSGRRWNAALTTGVTQAIAVASQYAHFEVCFQAFHKDRFAAHVVSPRLVRFTVPGSERDRQVSAYQKGHRPSEVRFATDRPEQPVPSARVRDTFESVLRGCRHTGTLSFECDDPWDLWRKLLPEYRDRAKALARRQDTLSLGGYQLGDFNEVYAALIAVCAAHDFLCFRWGQAYGSYPLDSAVMVRPVPEWVAVLAALSGVSPEQCRVMIADLTFSPSRSVDLHVHPFVPVDAANGTLALAPPFPLHSRHDENILRVCSQRRPQVYDATSLEKESEMLAELRSAAPRYAASGPFSLPDPTPDIDFMAVDEPSSTVVIAELKWIRKTLRPAEIPDRDADVLKGIGQLSAIRAFLAGAPTHLSMHGRLPRPVNQYEHVYFLLVARDHWRWVEPRDGIAIVEFVAFERALTRSNDLRGAMVELLRYDWLPLEGRDFFVRYDRATANGVSIESPVFYSTATP